jgi:hypothetical protein
MWHLVEQQQDSQSVKQTSPDTLWPNNKYKLMHAGYILSLPLHSLLDDGPVLHFRENLGTTHLLLTSHGCLLICHEYWDLSNTNSRHTLLFKASGAVGGGGLCLWHSVVSSMIKAAPP